MPRKYYSAKEMNETVNAASKLKAVEEMLRRMEREQGTAKTDEGRARKQTRKWRQERKGLSKEAERKYKEQVQTAVYERSKAEPKTDNPAYEKELAKVQKTAIKKIRKARLRKAISKIGAHAEYVSRVGERATTGSFERAYTTRQPTHQYTKNIRSPHNIVKKLGRMIQKTPLPRGRPDWLVNRPIIDVTGQKNVFSNPNPAGLGFGFGSNAQKEKKDKGNSLFWR